MTLEEALALIKDVPHFPKAGVVFKDITPVFEDVRAFAALMDSLVESVSQWKPQKIVALESRGFLIGSPLALRLNCGLALVRKKGKLPRATLKQSYDLEYGTDEIEIHQDALKKGERVVLVDDVLATGGTLGAALSLCERAGAQILGSQVILELGFLGGRNRLNGHKLRSLQIINS